MASKDNIKFNISSTKELSNTFIYKNIIIIALATLLNFTSFGGILNLQSVLHQNKGFVILGVQSASIVLSLFFLPNIVTLKCGYKYPLIVSLIGFAMFLLVQIYPELWLMVIVAIICGKLSVCVDVTGRGWVIVDSFLGSLPACFKGKSN